MQLPTVIIKDATMNSGKPYGAHKMPDKANDNKPAQIEESRMSVMNRLTRDINQQLLVDQKTRMLALVKHTNMTAADIGYCNVRAAGQFFLASLHMITCEQTRRRLIEEFDMLSNQFLK